MSVNYSAEDIKKRFKELDLSITDAAQKLGIHRQTLYDHLAKKPLTDFFIWLVETKIGMSDKTDGFHSNVVLLDMGNEEVMNIPLVNQYAYAGYLDGYFDDTYIETLPKIAWTVDKEHKGKYMSFEVKGESMDDGSRDSYIEGDILLCREVKPEHWQSKLHIKKWDFVIVHKTRGVTLKKITAHNVAQGILKLHPLNSEFEDFEVQLDDVKQIFNVVQVKRKK